MPQDANEPLQVTVAITTHNRRKRLQRALQSAQAQTYQNLEILVSDDASTDGTREWMSEVRDPRVRYVPMDQPGGVSGNYHNAVNNARGDLFMILNDDDELEPDAIANLARCFWEPPEGYKPEQIVLSWCPCQVQDGERRVRYVTDGGPPIERGAELVIGLFNGVRGPRFSGILLRTKDARAIGYPKKLADVGNWTRAAVRGGFACCVSAPLVRYTAHDASATGTSTPESWQRAGESILRDLVADLEKVGDQESIRRLLKSRKNLITNLLITVLMQSYGRPGWTLRVLREFLRAPQYFITPLIPRRLLLEGRKLFRKGKG